MNIEFLDKIKLYTVNLHDYKRSYYDQKSYGIHLNICYEVGLKYLYLIPLIDQTDVLCGIWCHDLIEECAITYNDLKKQTNERVANISYACTNEKGKTRKERANEKYYRGIRETEYAVFVKLCDRIGNVIYSKNSGSTMFEVYKKENPYFESQLNIVNSEFNVMFTELQNLFI